MTAPPAGRFEAFCVVGLGGHARSKLIPALEANRQRVIGLVTRGVRRDLPDAPVFADVETALADLPAETVFLIATPPPLHFRQVLPLLREGRDVIVEKPAFVSRGEAVEATEEASRSGSVLVEGFMHRHTALYTRLLDAWRREGRFSGVAAEFLIPEMPTSGTFRSAPDIACSSLFDMGCYPLSLLSDLGLPLAGLELARVDHPGDPYREALRLAGRMEGVDVDIGIGVGPAYANRVSIQSRNGRLTTFEPFFYGRPGERRITIGTGASSSELTVFETSAFETMFGLSRGFWIADQEARLRRMIEVAGALERLGGSLATFRKDGAL